MPSAPDTEANQAPVPSRWLFWLTALIASVIHWIPHFPPQIDLAQHAAQIRMLHAFHTGINFASRDIMTLNYFTPYLPAYITGAVLTSVMPVVVTVKLLWTLGAFGTVYTTVRLRRAFSANHDWDWIMVPGLFGMTFKWGFLTFVLALPIGLFIVELWVRHLRGPRHRSGTVIALALAALFFAHALVTVWVMCVCGLMLLCSLRSLAELRNSWDRFLPLLSPLPAALGWLSISRDAAQTHSATTWDWDFRYSNFFAQWLGIDDLGLAILAGVAILGAAGMAGARLARDPVRLAPLAVTLLVLLLGPNVIFGNAFTYNRFFSLLGSALVCALATKAPQDARSRARRYALPAIGVASVLLASVHMVRFAREQSDFRLVLRAMAPGRRTLSVVQESNSQALGRSLEYLNFPVWYQAERGGLVEPNFAAYLPMIVRFRAATDAGVPFQFEARPDIDRIRDLTRFEYVLIRAAPNQQPLLGARPLHLLAHEGQWWLFAVPKLRAQKASIAHRKRVHHPAQRTQADVSCGDRRAACMRWRANGQQTPG